ncbi:hypothetical protein [Phocicoccus pinnipedialis]|uniref:Uncharacterized protein n=1 Tax=Phocicoccus pinnipedialis TaxID=110845 RepID=A0A6V7R9J0_9BACL|nr:hypothetical protein [Jeotgalicoccus pinnipedialis]MBP1940225.1 biotin operon repressor [Jeotgalicoccus pinnipedialis]CAD2074109.1 hypothetical protein JEOPIN946_00805 [Jeotgalicoccus pinnipedialis]
MAQIYSMKALSEKLGYSRNKLKKKIDELEIKAINEDTREYTTEPLQYNHDTYLLLVEELDDIIEEKTTKRTKRKQKKNKRKWWNILKNPIAKVYLVLSCRINTMFNGVGENQKELLRLLVNFSASL